MTHRQDTVSSLILAPIRSGLRGFCLFVLEIFLLEYLQKNPLKYYALPFLSKFVNKVQFRLVGFAKAKGYRKINFFTRSSKRRISRSILRGPHLKDFFLPSSFSTIFNIFRSSFDSRPVSISMAIFINRGWSFTPQGSVSCMEDLFLTMIPFPSRSSTARRQFSCLFRRLEPMPM